MTHSSVAEPAIMTVLREAQTAVPPQKGSITWAKVGAKCTSRGISVRIRAVFRQLSRGDNRCRGITEAHPKILYLRHVWTVIRRDRHSVSRWARSSARLFKVLCTSSKTSLWNRGSRESIMRPFFLKIDSWWPNQTQVAWRTIGRPQS